jgi:uncharacterized membrane protein YagU involved in acid resistance
MTVAMLAMHQMLPEHEQYPLPPEQITAVSAHRAGAHEVAEDSEQRRAVALALHFGFGAAAGSLFPLAHDGVKIPSVVTGVAYGVAVWAVNYLVTLPAARILPPATEHPVRRNLLMIAAHIVWGSVLGATYERLAGEKD